MQKKEITKRFDACGRSLDRLQVESRKSLNLLSLVISFPNSMEPRTAAQLQLDREILASTQYQRELRRLRVLIGAPANSRKA